MCFLPDWREEINNDNKKEPKINSTVFRQTLMIMINR